MEGHSNATNGDGFSELLGLIEGYARGTEENQQVALKLIAGTYVRAGEGASLPDVKPIVDGILEHHGYCVPYGGPGSLYPQSVYAVLNAATYSGRESDRRWGASRLSRIMQALGSRSQSGEAYTKCAVDASLVSSALTQLAKTAQLSRTSASSLN